MKRVNTLTPDAYQLMDANHQSHSRSYRPGALAWCQIWEVFVYSGKMQVQLLSTPTLLVVDKSLK